MYYNIRCIGVHTHTYTLKTGFSANSWNDRTPSHWRDAKMFTRPRNFRVYIKK